MSSERPAAVTRARLSAGSRKPFRPSIVLNIKATRILLGTFAGDFSSGIWASSPLKTMDGPY